MRGVVLVSLASFLTGCIVIPAGHRHHRHGYASVVVPVKLDRRDDRRDGYYGRGHRDERYDRDDSGPRRW